MGLEALETFDSIANIKAVTVFNRINKEQLLVGTLNNGVVSIDLNSGNIGKSYRRHDEVGTPLCITLDFQTLEDQTLTVRNRDNMEQERIHQNETAAYLQEIIK